MLHYLENSSLVRQGIQGNTAIYSLEGGSFKNSYYTASNAGTRNLLASPEVVGYDSYLAMLGATTDMLTWLKAERGLADSTDILTILRGGLNYPLEESCHSCGIRVGNIDFISCERVIKSNRITGLDIRYTKLEAPKDITLMIGDIIASGETLVRCMKYVISEFHRLGGSINRLVFFTIGGTRAMEIIEELDAEFRFYWPDFKGIDCIFYEGIFSAYQDHGVSGISWPDIDFFWKEGVISPEFRTHVLNDDDALFEKCIIYDGGARRYNIPEHIEEVTEYWEQIQKVAGNFRFRLFLEEKLGYPTPISYDDWLQANHYQELPHEEMDRLYRLEKLFVDERKHWSLEDVAARRLSEFRKAMESFTK